MALSTWRSVGFRDVSFFVEHAVRRRSDTITIGRDLIEFPFRAVELSCLEISLAPTFRSAEPPSRPAV
jgi:hypothetical protein